MATTAIGSSSKAGAAHNHNYNGLHNQSNDTAGPSYSNKVEPLPLRHFYLNGDEEDDAIDELRAIGSNIVPYDLDTGSRDGQSDDGIADGTETQQDDDDELSTTSGRRHGALLQPEEADMIIFEVRRNENTLRG